MPASIRHIGKPLRPWYEYDKLRLVGAVIGSIMAAAALACLRDALAGANGVDFFVPLGSMLGFVVIFLTMTWVVDRADYILKAQYRLKKSRTEQNRPKEK